MCKNFASIAIGIVMVMIGLWGGSWLLELFPVGSQYNFAAFVTASIMTIGGLFIAIHGFFEEFA